MISKNISNIWLADIYGILWRKLLYIWLFIVCKQIIFFNQSSKTCWYKTFYFITVLFLCILTWGRKKLENRIGSWVKISLLDWIVSFDWWFKNNKYKKQFTYLQECGSNPGHKCLHTIHFVPLTISFIMISCWKEIKWVT